MNRRGAGIILLLISAMLFSTRYLGAAIFAPKGSDAIDFQTELGDIGAPLLILSILALLVGLIYLIASEWDMIWTKRE